ncbi:SHOCT domain-containing protein [Candidatus Hydrogenisulfobacillus filiaventi]|uniref:SHOCT domain-containing protein n=1 Tax=Candidatus Hydrogenisulfobacillus filiaventi TaxID=2707344 RepID=A0A6F8ZJ69_9FIRM|nr:SHOCT domain-containing protein [Candidatus Hydrogenisulfobacillus filiaventi]
MMGWVWGNAFGGWWWMGLLHLAWVTGIILLLVWAVPRILRRSGGPAETPPADPLAQLKLRLARGEITPDEYEELRAHLRG